MNSTGRIGIIMPEIVDPLDYEMLDGAYAQAVKLGYDGIMHSIIHEPQITTVAGRDMQLGETAVCRLYE